MLRIFRSSARKTLVRRPLRRLLSTKASDSAPAASGTAHASTNDTSLFNQHVYEERKAFIRAVEEKKGKNALYPPFVSDCSVGAYLDEIQHLEPGQKIPEKEYTLTGRIMSKRDASKKLVFYVIRSELRDVQIVANLSEYTEGEEEYNFLNRNLRRGDIIGSLPYI
jgi:lysyl-tRNA synthetase class II